MHNQMLYNSKTAGYRARLHNKNLQNGGLGQAHATTEEPACNTPYDFDDATPNIEHRAKTLRLPGVDLACCASLYCLSDFSRSRAVPDPASSP